MLTVKRTFDYELVRQILVHPKIYPWISDDCSLPPQECAPVASEKIYYIYARNGHPVGLFIFMPQNGICYDLHVCVLPEAWGRESVPAGKLAIQWMFEHTLARRITGSVADYNRLACRYAEKLEMEEFGVNRKSYLHDGVLYDQHLFGISKGDAWAR